MKLTQLIEESAAQLDAATVAYGHGTLNAHDEATWLILWQLKMPLDMEVSDDTSVSASQILACQHLIQQRISTRKPAAYLTQEAWLQGIPFYVDERSIVPRSFIAELIADGAFDGWLKESSHQFLDLCTGNGSLAVLCAMAYPDIAVVAVATGPNPLPAIHSFLDKAGVHTLTVLRDPTQDLAHQMGVMGLPVTVIVNPEGMEVARLIGGADWSAPETLAVLDALR